MPAVLTAAYQATGTAHIIAISGFNMAVLSGLFLGLFSKLLTRWWAALAAVVSLAGYSLLVGGGASVLRAAIMCALAITAAQIGRTAGAFNALMLSAGVMCLFDPNLPWDVSFQLTFAATAGLMLYAGPLQGWFAGWARRRLPGWLADRIVAPVGEYLLCTLAAQLTTLPLIVWHFGRLSLSSLLANPLVLPPQAPLMVLGGLAVFFGLLWEPLGRLFALLAWPLAAYTNRVVEGLAQLPGGQIVLGPDGAVLVAVLCALVMAAALLRERLRTAWGLVRPALVLLLLAGLALFTWRAALSAPDARLHLTILDVQGGPAVLLRSPQGQTLLIGGADNASALESALGRRLPPVGARLDGLLLAWPQGAAGLAGTLAVVPAAQVFSCLDLSGAPLDAVFQAGSLPVQDMSAQRELRLGAQVRVEAAAQTDLGCALRVRMGRFDLLLPGALAPDQFPAGTQAPSALVAGVSDAQVWQQAGRRVLTPPPGGWLELQTDGAQLWLESGR
jgi:competence protein ComEC